MTIDSRIKKMTQRVFGQEIDKNNSKRMKNLLKFLCEFLAFFFSHQSFNKTETVLF